MWFTQITPTTCESAPVSRAANKPCNSKDGGRNHQLFVQKFPVFQKWQDNEIKQCKDQIIIIIIFLIKALCTSWNKFLLGPETLFHFKNDNTAG